MIWAGVIAILIMAALGAPLFAVLLAASMLGFYSAEIDLAIVAIELYRIVDTPLLVALPLFTFSGYLLSEANTSTRLVNLMQSLFGFLPSGLAIVAFVACAEPGPSLLYCDPLATGPDTISFLLLMSIKTLSSRAGRS